MGAGFFSGLTDVDVNVVVVVVSFVGVIVISEDEEVVVVRSDVDVGSVVIDVVNGIGDSDVAVSVSGVIFGVNDDVVADVSGVAVGVSVGSDNSGVGVNGDVDSDRDGDIVVIAVVSGVDGAVDGDVFFVCGVDRSVFVVLGGNVDIKVVVDVEVIWLFVSFSTFVVLVSLLLFWIEACS